MRKSANRELDYNEYRKIPSLEFLYEVNCVGKVRNVKSKRVLAYNRAFNNYLLVGPTVRGEKLSRTVHSLVAECWLGPKPEGYQIDHIDRNKNNNCFDNLRYVTTKENNDNRVFAKSITVIISKDNETMKFDTLTKCAKYISSVTGKSYSHIASNLSWRRKHMYGFDIRYLFNEETEHGSLKRQETVHSNVYLVGTLDRFNNAKRAEERDRVKHGV